MAWVQDHCCSLVRETRFDGGDMIDSRSMTCLTGESWCRVLRVKPVAGCRGGIVAVETSPHLAV